MIATTLFLAFAVLLAGGVPVAICLGLAGAFAIWLADQSIMAMPTNVYAGIAKYPLLAIFGAKLAYDEYRFEVLSNGLGNPQWLYTGWLPLVSLLVIARATGRLIRLARGEDG